MKGYLIDYDSIDIYHIYHPEAKTIKISRDIIFCENEFINKHRYKSTNLVKNDFNNELKAKTLVNDELSDIASVISNSKPNNPASSIIYNEIMIQSSLKFIGIKSASYLSLNRRQQ